MKIAYLSNYRDTTGYSTAARGYIKGLVAAGADVVTRHVHLSGEESEDQFKELSSKPMDNVDVCIQHTLPSFFRKTEAKTDIGIFTWETTTIPPNWANNINKSVDGVIVPSDLDKYSCIDHKTNNVTKPIFTVGYPISINKNEIDLDAKIKDNMFGEDTHVFYSISSNSPRKNLSSLIMAYCCEFRETDNCILMLHISSDDSKATERWAIDTITEIREGLRLGSYAKIAISTNMLSKKTVEHFHIICDTYVSVSHGESWNYPLFDAHCLSNNIITMKSGGPSMYLPNDFGYIKSVYCPVYGMAKSDDDLYTARGQWQNFIMTELMYRMRYEKEDGKVKSKINEAIFTKYSYKNIGKKLLKAIKQIQRGEE